jgi:hypothetical protein
MQLRCNCGVKNGFGWLYFMAIPGATRVSISEKWLKLLHWQVLRKLGGSSAKSPMKISRCFGKHVLRSSEKRLKVPAVYMDITSIIVNAAAFFGYSCRSGTSLGGAGREDLKLGPSRNRNSCGEESGAIRAVSGTEVVVRLPFAF